MLILINATSCVVGGGVQVAVGLIRHVVAESVRRSWQVRILVSSAVACACAQEVEAAGVAMVVFDCSPGSLRGGAAVRRALLHEAMAFRADMVFTVFGPSYVRFPVPELMGFAVPFVITPYPGCYANHGLTAALAERFRSAVKRWYLRYAAEYWVETQTAANGLCAVAGVGLEKVHVVSNGVNALLAQSLSGRLPRTQPELLVMGAGYPHKNHSLLVPVATRLRSLLPEVSWRWVVTLPSDSPVWLQLHSAACVAGVADRIHNAGVLSLSECAAAYESAALVFHPSLLEIFSATYVEAMAARRPLVVSDRPFAREICGDAALYFDPLDAQSAAEAIARVLTDSGVRERLVSAGIERLKSFPDAAVKNGRLCDLIDAFASRHVKPGKEARSCQ